MASPGPKCVKCEGENRNASVTGLLVLTGLRQDGDAHIDGQILGPDTGSAYKSQMQRADNGQKPVSGVSSASPSLAEPKFGSGKNSPTPTSSQ